MTIISTNDSTKRVALTKMGDGLMATAELFDGLSWSYWYHIGNYKTEKNAVRYSARSLKSHGIELAI